MDPGDVADRGPLPKLQECFLSLYEQFNRLFRIARRRLGNDHIAEELVQETYRAAWQNIETLLSHPNPQAYLFTILRNKISDFYRKESREKNAQPEPCQPTLPFEIQPAWFLDLSPVARSKHLGKTLRVLRENNWDRHAAREQLGYTPRTFRKYLQEIKRWATQQNESVIACHDAWIAPLIGIQGGVPTGISSMTTYWALVQAIQRMSLTARNSLIKIKEKMNRGEKLTDKEYRTYLRHLKNLKKTVNALADGTAKKPPQSS